MCGNVYVKRFAEIGKTDVPTAGGKGANLGEMTSAGLAVPTGFVVTADAYRAFIAENGLAGFIADELKIAGADESKLLGAAAAFREKITAGKLPDDYNYRTLLSFYGTLGLMNVEFHLIQLPEQIIGEFQVCLIYFVYQQDHLLIALKSLSQLAQFDISGDIVHALFAELSVIETLYRIIHIQAVLGLGR